MDWPWFETQLWNSLAVSHSFQLLLLLDSLEKKPCAPWNLLDTGPVPRERLLSREGPLFPVEPGALMGARGSEVDERQHQIFSHPFLFYWLVPCSAVGRSNMEGGKSSKALKPECAQQRRSWYSWKLAFGSNNSVWQRWKHTQFLRVMGQLKSLS